MHVNNKYLPYIYKGFAMFLSTSARIIDKRNPSGRFKALEIYCKFGYGKSVFDYRSTGVERKQTMFGQVSVVSIIVMPRAQQQKSKHICGK